MLAYGRPASCSRTRRARRREVSARILGGFLRPAPRTAEAEAAAPPAEGARAADVEALAAASRTPLMAGNWKLNPATLDAATTLAALVAAAARNDAEHKPDRDVEVLVCPPYPYLHKVAELLEGTPVKLGAQDVHFEAKGAFTGAVSASMVRSLGCEFALAGHSERRATFGDSDADIGRKVRAILDEGMTAVLCIGETKEEYEAGLVQTVCATQLEGALDGVSAEEMSSKVVIAYEPVWAIGTGLSATPAIAQSVHAYIRSWVRETYGPAVAGAVRIQYGGSVTPETVDELMMCPDIDGCLVGGASLVPDKFARIFNFDTTPDGPSKLWATEVVKCRCELGESPVWSQEAQKLYWVSSVGRELWEWDLVSEAKKVDLPEVVGCVALRAGGTLLLPLESGIVAYDPATGASTHLCDFEPGLNTRPNDGRCDRDGNFVIGSYNNAHRQDGQDIGGLYRLSAETGELKEILGYRFRCSNCICFTPDGRKMFFCDTPTRRIFTFDYSPSGALSNRELLYEVPSSLDGGPDGAQCDAEGYLWAAISGASQVVRIAPDGTVDTVVELPVKSPTSCTIGGPDLDTLFVTTRGPDGGGLYAVKLPEGMRGQVEPEFGDAKAVSGPPLAASPSVGGAAPGAARFCEQCGAGFKSASARFCSACGAQRA